MSDARHCTPYRYVEVVRRMLGEIDLDPCGNAHSEVDALTEFLPPDRDGLALDWFGRVYLNPPWGYDWKSRGETLATWLRKLDAERDVEETVVLVPTAPHADWWKEWVGRDASALCFVEERTIDFVMQTGAAFKVDCSFLYYGPRTDAFCDVFHELGPTWRKA